MDQSQSNYLIANKQNKPFKLTRERTVHIYFQQIRYEHGKSHTVAASFCWRSTHTGVHTNDFAPIYGRRAKKLGHASLATVFRHGRLTFQPILWENLESPVLRYQPITTAVITDACLNTRRHHGAYTSAVLREPLGLDRVVTASVRGSVGAMNAGLSRPDWLATVQSGRKQAQSRVCTPGLAQLQSARFIFLNRAD